MRLVMVFHIVYFTLVVPPRAYRKCQITCAYGFQESLLYPVRVYLSMYVCVRVSVRYMRINVHKFTRSRRNLVVAMMEENYYQ